MTSILKLIAPYLSFVILLTLGIFLYGRWLDSPLVFDDINFFTSNYISQYSSSLTPLAARFWPYASFAHEALFFNHTYHEMRIVNTAIHIFNAFLVGVFFLKLLLLSNNHHANEKSIYLCSLICSCMFLLHPISVYATAYLVQRTMLMATLFSLLMWISYIQAIQDGKTRWLFFTVLFFYLAAFSKQQATLSILAIPLLSYLYWNQLSSHISIKKFALPFLLSTGILLASLLQSSNLIARNYEPLLTYQSQAHEAKNAFLIPELYLRSILTQAEMFIRYLELMAFPNPFAMSIDIRLGLIDDPYHWKAWTGLFAYIAFGLTSLLMLLKRRLLGVAGLGLLITFTLFLTEFSTVRAQEVFVIYRSYLWMTGFTVTIGAAAYYLVTAFRNRFIMTIFGALLITLFIASNQRLKTFSSEKLLWSDAIRLYEQEKPANSTFAERAYYARGLVFAKEQNFDSALIDINQAIALNPDYYLAHHAKGEVEFALGQYEAALGCFKTALTIRKNYSPSRISLAKTLIKLDKMDEGLQELEMACKQRDISACFYLHRLKSPDSDFTYIRPNST